MGVGHISGALDEIGDSNDSALVLGEDGRVKPALQEKVFAAWLAAAQRVALGILTSLAACGPRPPDRGVR